MIGVIMLDTRFPRVYGDIGNPDTFPGPVVYERVEHAAVSDIVAGGSLSDAMSAAFCDAARRLQRRGATVIGTSCGLLGPMQHALQAAVSCPVLSSTLLLLPLLRAAYGPPIGVLTFDADCLERIDPGLTMDDGVVLQGLPKGGELYTTILLNRTSLDVRRARKDAVQTALTLTASAPDITALVLECTNLSPYKAELKRTTGLAVFDLVDALVWMKAAASA